MRPHLHQLLMRTPRKSPKHKRLRDEKKSRELLKAGVSESDPQIRLNNEECYKSISIVYRKYKRRSVLCKNKGRDPKLPRIPEEEESTMEGDNIAEEDEEARDDDLTDF